jgi:HEAT repeat protein
MDETSRGSVRPGPTTSAFQFRSNPTHPLNAHIVDAVRHLHAPVRDAGGHFGVSLAALRRAAPEAAPILHAEYRDLPIERSHERWSLVYLLSRLGHPVSLPALEAIAAEPLPRERADDPHHGGTTAREVMIRTTAAEGLGDLAAAGDREAIDRLLRHASHHPVFSVRRTCAQAYLEHGGPDARGVLLRALPPGEHFVVDLRVIDPGDVPAVEPPARRRSATEARELQPPPRAAPRRF